MSSSYFVFGLYGRWTVTGSAVIGGSPVEGVDDALSIEDAEPAGAGTVLRGFASNVRYATRREVSDLRAVQEGLGCPAARRAALIPIKKSQAWWDFAKDERRAIFEEQSRHHSIGIGYLPQIARKLYDCRDLGEPFDFLTWFEFAPEDEVLFNRLVAELRASREWTYITREIDIRLSRTP